MESVCVVVVQAPLPPWGGGEPVRRGSSRALHCYVTVSRDGRKGRSAFPLTKRTCYFSDKLYVVGGSDSSSSLATVEIFDPVAQTWSFGPMMSIPRANVGVAVLQNRLFAVGGFSGKAFLDSVEYLAADGNEWSSCVPAPEKNALAEEKMNNASQRVGLATIEKLPCIANGNVDTKSVKKPQNTDVQSASKTSAVSEAKDIANST